MTHKTYRYNNYTIIEEVFFLVENFECVLHIIIIIKQ
jgi:hypothetical protein